MQELEKILEEVSKSRTRTECVIEYWEEEDRE